MTSKVKTGLFWTKDDKNQYRLISIKNDEGVTMASCAKNGKKGIVMNSNDLFSPIFEPYCPQVFHKITPIKEKELEVLLENFSLRKDETKDIIKMHFLDSKKDDEISEIINKKRSGISRLLKRFKYHCICQECNQAIRNDESLMHEGYYWYKNRESQKIEPIYIQATEHRLIAKKFFTNPNMSFDIEVVKDDIIAKISEPIDIEDKGTELGVQRAIERVSSNLKKPFKDTCNAVEDVILSNYSLTKAAKIHHVPVSSVMRLTNKVMEGFCNSCGSVKKQSTESS